MKNIIFDLDGTILESDNSLSQETIKCIRHVSNNNFVTIATGRSAAGLPVCLLEIRDCINYYITSNGASIFDKNKEAIYKDSINSNEVDSFLRQILKNDNTVVEILSEDGWHIDANDIKKFHRVNLSSAVLQYIFESRQQHMDLINYLISNNVKIEKITINFCSPVNQNEIYKIHSLCEKNGFRFFSDHPHKIDIYKISATKGNAIAFLNKRVGLRKDDNISFGNDENDIDMFDCCSASVCMKDSPRIVKKHATICLRKNDSARIDRGVNVLKRKGLISF